MVTVEQVKDLGIEFVADDIIVRRGGDFPSRADKHTTSRPTNSIEMYTNIGFMCPDWTVTEFSQRENEGAQPVGDNVLVDVVLRCGFERTIIASHGQWGLAWREYDIITWKPSFKNWENDMNDNQEIKIGMTCADDEPSKLVIDAKDAIKVDLGDGSEWNGEGLPPVGITCQAFDYDKNDWVDVKTLDAITLADEMAVAVINPGGGYRKVFFAAKFRKPETQEQREERETISELCKLVENDEYTNSLNVNLGCSVVMRAVIELIAREGYRLEVKQTEEEE